MIDANIKFLKVRATRQNTASDYYDHYCNAGMEMAYDLFRVLFSTQSRCLAMDAKQQIRLNSNNNSYQTKIAPFTNAKLAYMDHSANIVEKEGKLGLNTVTGDVEHPRTRNPSYSM